MMKSAFLAASAGVLTAVPAYGQDPSLDWLADVRARYEAVEQPGKLDAQSLTVRTRLGARLTSADDRFSFLAELENNAVIDGDERNTSDDPRPQYATINDPDFTELNRLQLTGMLTDELSVVLGRQYLDFDDGRFVASAGWRQDKNSHDAVLFNLGHGRLEARYAYHWRINRGPGTDYDWDTDAHLFHAAYGVSDSVELTGFVYAIDVTEPGRANLSNLTLGGTVSGGASLNGTADLFYSLMLARQSDYGSATADFDNNFLSGEIGFRRGGLSASLGYDVATGNGAGSIVNPLGKNHGFFGWSDVFSGGGRAVSADGLEDLHVALSYGGDFAQGPFQSWEVGVTWHDFEAENTGFDLGHEWDAEIGFGLTERVGLAFQIADYDGPDTAFAPDDRLKQWIILTYRR